MAVTEERSAETCLEDARRAGVKRVRVHFTDLIGVSRNKVVPLSILEELCDDGVNFCIGAYAVAHSGEVIEETGLGGEVEFRDMKVYPDLTTLRVLPWESDTGRLHGRHVEFDGESLAVDPRGILKRAIAELEKRGFTAACGHELEFFLLRPGASGYEQYASTPGLVYTHTPAVDSEGVIREMEDAVTALGLPYVCSNQEYFGSQWEINLKLRRGARGRRRRASPEARDQGDRRQARARRDLHGKAARRRGHLGLPPPPLALGERRRTRSKTWTHPTASRTSAGTSSPASSSMGAR